MDNETETFGLFSSYEEMESFNECVAAHRLYLKKNQGVKTEHLKQVVVKSLDYTMKNYPGYCGVIGFENFFPEQMRFHKKSWQVDAAAFCEFIEQESSNFGIKKIKKKYKLYFYGVLSWKYTKELEPEYNKELVLKDIEFHQELDLITTTIVFPDGRQQLIEHALQVLD